MLFEARVLTVVGAAILLLGTVLTVALDDSVPLVLGGVFGLCYLGAGSFCHQITKEDRDR